MHRIWCLSNGKSVAYGPHLGYVSLTSDRKCQYALLAVTIEGHRGLGILQPCTIRPSHLTTRAMVHHELRKAPFPICSIMKKRLFSVRAGLRTISSNPASLPDVTVMKTLDCL